LFDNDVFYTLVNWFVCHKVALCLTAIAKIVKP